MSEPIRFTLDGAEVEAQPGETIWQVANRQGVEIPHLCWLPEPGYSADGNCRACMVEIEGERVLAASCIRQPTSGMKVKSASERASAARDLARPDLEILGLGRPPRRPRLALSRRPALGRRCESPGDARQSRCLHP